MLMHRKFHTNWDIHAELIKLFDAAKETDEFEYCSTFLRLRGMEDAGWDTLIESNNTINQTLRVIQSPIADDFRLRLLLFTYCHATEMHDLYNVIGNMLCVILGNRYSMNCFLPNLHASKKLAKYPPAKVERIKEWAISAKLPNIGDMFDEMLVREVRNAFFHSDYILHERAFHIKRGDGVTIERTMSRKVNLDWLLPRLELGINVAFAMIDLTLNSIRSYKANKIVMGRIQGPKPVPIELIADPEYGLSGFQSPPQSSLV